MVGRSFPDPVSHHIILKIVRFMVTECVLSMLPNILLFSEVPNTFKLCWVKHSVCSTWTRSNLWSCDMMNKSNSWQAGMQADGKNYNNNFLLKSSKSVLQGIPIFHDFTICDPLYFVIQFQASISWIPRHFMILNKKKS